MSPTTKAPVYPREPAFWLACRTISGEMSTPQAEMPFRSAAITWAPVPEHTSSSDAMGFPARSS